MENREIQQYSLEWYKEMRKLNKDTIISLVESNGKQRDALKEQNKQLLDEIEELKKRLHDTKIERNQLENENNQLQRELKNKEWISVEDRLPTERVEFVLLFNADAPKYNQCVYQGTWFLQEKKFKSDTSHNLLGTITHWMPLPNQPK